MIVTRILARTVARKRDLDTPRHESGEQRPDTHETSGDEDDPTFDDC
jgi:hypothetical protein